MTSTHINIQNRPEDDEEIASFVHRWADAIISNDVQRLARFTTDDWILIDKPGQITRDMFHGVVASGMLRHDTMTHDVVDIRRLGPDIAVVITHCRNTGSFEGQPIEADEWTTDILIRSNDGWRCTLTQLTPHQLRPAT